MKILYIFLLISSVAVKKNYSQLCEECTCSTGVIDCRKSSYVLQENATIDSGIKEAYLSGLSIDFIGPNSFVCDNCTIELLDLSANNIETVPGNTFHLLNTLTRLKLRNNKISMLKNNSFKDLLDLTILDLGFNKINHLPSELLNKLLNLSVLDLKYNEISHIPDEFFFSSQNLKNLDLSHLRLKSLPNEIFIWNLSIENLDISHNLFTVVPTEALSHLDDSLKTLKMSGNRLKTLPSGAFKRLRSLNFIQMEQLLQLQSIEAYAFSGLENLEDLELRYLPEIRTINEKAFHLEESSENETVTFCPLYDFTLCFSTLPFLPPNLLDWENTRQIMLKNNQWNCNCSMKWIKGSTVETKTGSSMYCSLPSNVRGRNIINLQEDDFTCGITPVNDKNEIVLLIVIFAIGLLVSTATVMVLVYRRNGWILKRPGGFNLLENETITVYDRTAQLSSISKPYQTTVETIHN